ncbi:carboxypeptidase-like regulatory domain-containing protein [Psychroserpens damuponensis]|uniref:carboxypeptidase-like regulatory domain-containing protein n=1 Tax=Psychroserpens damuponensis TaxID=943936 RepID=UPI000A578EC7|nr:carboxypeptidase-like regulatory domain-containing protein [Psychroserpens damuponensis]
MVLFFLTSFLSEAQETEISGNIVDKTSLKPVPDVNILLKNLNGLILDYTSTDLNGDFNIKLPAGFDKLILETSIISHLAYRKEILISDYKNSNITLDISLEERLTALKEVYIEGKKRPITVKKDTTVYNINQFKDGTEQVVEDLLKKLPGITVSENGNIKFKGKRVIRLLLDGDNLFDSNYTVGSRNINSNIIASIEAIEDYNTNPLLKGVKSSDDVAVNLILKEGKVDVSGDAEVGLGIEDRTYLRANMISVSKKLKGFGTFSHNNIGENYSPYNFVSNSLDISSLNEINQRTSNLVNGSGFNSSLPDHRVRVNNNFFGSLNALYKINKDISLRGNYNLFADKLKRNETNAVLYNFEDTQIDIFSQNNIDRIPTLHNVSSELIYHINKKSLFTAKGKFESKNITENAIGNNNGLYLERTSVSKDLFFNTDLEYTYKVDSKSVLQIVSNMSSNKIPQDLEVLEETDFSHQAIDIEKTTFNVQSNYFTKQKNIEYGFSLGYNFETNDLVSNLDGIQTSLSLTNQLNYKLSKPFLNLSYNYNKNKWQFLAEVENQLLNIKIEDANLESTYSNSEFILNPSLTLKYSISKNANYYVDYNLSNQIPTLSNIYSGLILRDVRSLLVNDFSFNLFNNHSYTLGYEVNDFYNLFQFNLFGRYSYNKYGYVNSFNVSEDVDFYTSIVNVTNNNNYNFGLRLEKYLHFMRSTLNFDSNYSINEYQNIINDSELRNNKSKSLFAKFQLRTGFKSAINFENKIAIRNNVFDNQDGSTNSFTALQTDFKTKFVKNEFQFVFTTQYVKPDLKTNINGDLFLDASLNYKPKKGKIEYQLKANNLLNNSTYQNINVSDFSSSNYEHNLIERLVLLSVKFKF